METLQCVGKPQRDHEFSTLAGLEQAIIAARREIPMVKAPDTLVGKSIEWTGVHHSAHGDFTELSTHVVTYETEYTFYVTAGGKLATGDRSRRSRGGR
jgi:hypothetical protein